VFLDKTLLPSYPSPIDTDDVESGQKFAHVCATLRNQIHASVLPSGHYLSRSYGSAKTVALDLTGIEYFDPDHTTLEQDQIDRLGVWWADPSDVFASPTCVADLATVATTLMVTALEYIDAFSKLIMCHTPVGHPNAHAILGAAPATSAPLPAPSEEELYHRKLFGLHKDSGVSRSGS
jgi:hypothetical protein